MPPLSFGKKIDSTAILQAMVDSMAMRDSVRRADSARADSGARKPATPAGPQATTGTLLVVGLPAGGRLSIDGKPMIPDAAGAAEVPPGVHRVAAQANGYRRL